MFNALIVDDEPRTIEALSKNVDWRKCGVKNIYKACSMYDAIAKMEQESVQIVICDIEMPNGSGLDFLEWSKENRQDLGFILVTCHPEFDYMRKAIQLKCDDYILKPINYDEFNLVLSKLVIRMEEGDDSKSQSEETVIEEYASQGITFDCDQRDVEREVKKYVKMHMLESISVTDIAEALHFNPQYLMRAFKKKTEMSIVEYITKVRLDKAKQLLKETNLPVKEIAGMVGYTDYAYFTRVFKKEVGESPNQYR